MDFFFCLNFKVIISYCGHCLGTGILATQESGFSLKGLFVCFGRKVGLVWFEFFCCGCLGSCFGLIWLFGGRIYYVGQAASTSGVLGLTSVHHRARHSFVVRVLGNRML